MGKTYVVTSAQAFAKPHKNFINGLEKYSEINGAEILILPMIGKSAREDWHNGGLDKLFYKKFRVVEENYKLNNNIEIEQFEVRPYQIDPLTGLQRFAQRSVTKIFASPKQRLKAISHSNYKIPKFLATTGACTYPNYATGEDVSAERRRLGNISKKDHVYGALIVEVEDKERYYLRNIRANKKGEFIDFGIRYNGKEIKKSKLEALVLGDIHCGYTDKKVREANYKMIKAFKPKRLILHDLFDGHSVCHWRDKHLITQMIIEGADKGFLSLEDELKEVNKELKKFSKAMKGGKIYVVSSNHLEFLDRYLDEGKFVKDALNAKISFDLARELAKGKNPVEVGVRMMGPLPKNIFFLKRDEDLKVRGYQLGSHGDKGPSGGRGSIRSRENDFGKSITGHSHSSQVLRETYIVGTSTPLTMFYTKGHPTSWTNSNAFLWDNGTVQMVHIIKGKWRLKNK